VKAVRCIVGTLLLSLVGIANAQGFRIDHWGEKIDLQQNAVIHVEERISVTFTDPKHGILRNIPVSYPTGHGTNRNISLDGLKVLDENNNPIEFREDDSGGQVKLRIGSANITLPAGTKKTYVIRYLVSNGINWMNEPTWVPSAELYWNVTGTDWPAEIRTCDVTITFPKVDNPPKVRLKVFTGPMGARRSQLIEGIAKDKIGEQTSTTSSLTNSTATISRNKTLPNGQGLTVVLNVPIKYIPKRKIVEERIGNSSDFAGGMSYDFTPYYPSQYNQPLFQPLTAQAALAGYLLPVAVFVAMFLLWILFGRDPKSGPMVVQYDPPDNLGGPECGAMIDERVDSRDLTAGIISLAVKGYIRIHPEDELGVSGFRTAKIEVLKSYNKDLPTFERTLISLISAGGKMLDDMELRSNVAPYVQNLRDDLYGELVELGYYPQSPNGVRYGWTAFGFALALALAICCYVLYPASIVILFATLPISVGIAYWISGGMPRRTKKGNEVRDKVIGFQEFMKRARTSELDWMTTRHPDQALFEQYLPHAVAFGLAKEWADAFKGILQEMPNWYADTNAGTFDSIAFINDLNRVSSAVSYYISVPPRPVSTGNSFGSDDSSGGFFSGGGFSSSSGGSGGGFSSGSSSGGGGYSGGGAGGGGGGSW